jgi:ubiquinone/menaquinone biosynthesis C-methylase UbiE
MTENKNHWYDGWFYDTIIAPNQDNLFRQIKKLIEPQSEIIDVGCGTGRLAFKLSSKSKSVLGIDLSKRNIDRARLSLFRRPDDRISFQHRNLRDIIKVDHAHFDYAILTYVIHEVDEKERINLLTEMSQVADKIIIGDYLVPKSAGFAGLLTEVIEYIAGAEHYRNYKSYMADGGIYHLADKAGLKIIAEITNQPSTNQIVVLGK